MITPIAQSTIVGFYIVAVGLLLLCSAPLFVLHREHPYSLWAILLGLGAYFIAYQLLTNYIWDRLLLIPGLMAFLESNYLLYYLVYVFLNAISMSPAAYILIKFTRRGEWNVYEAVAGGMSYWGFGGLYAAYSYITEARIAAIVNSGDVSSLISETVSEAQVEEYAAMLRSGSLGECIGQLVFFAAEVAMAILIFIIVYHGVKRKKIRFMFLAMLIHFVVILSCYYGSTMPLVWYMIICAACLAGCLYGIYRYFQWYHQRQRELNEQRQAIKERHKAATAAASVKNASARIDSAPGADKTN